MSAPEGGEQVAVLSPGAQLLALASGPRVRVYSLKEGTPKLRYAVEASAQVLCAAFSPDNEMLLTGAQDGSVAVWEVQRTAKPTYVFRPHPGGTSAVLWSESEGLFASAGVDGSLTLFGIDGRLQRAFHGPSQAKAVAFALGGCLLTGNDEGQVQLWTPFDEEPLKKRQLAVGVSLLATAPDAVTTAAVDAQGTLTVWRGDEVMGQRSHETVPRAIRFAPGRADLLGVLTGRTLEVLWVTGELQEQRRIELPFLGTDFTWAGDHLVILGTEGGRWLLRHGEQNVTLPAELGR